MRYKTIAVALALMIFSSCTTWKQKRAERLHERSVKLEEKAEELHPGKYNQDTITTIVLESTMAVIPEIHITDKVLTPIFKDTVLVITDTLGEIQTTVEIDYPVLTEKFLNSKHGRKLVEKLPELFAGDIKVVTTTKVPEKEIEVELPVENVEITKTVRPPAEVIKKTPFWAYAVMGLLAIILIIVLVKNIFKK